jgi:hypothetical protein
VNVDDGAGFVTGMRAEICTGAGVCASWGVQVCAFKLGCSGGCILRILGFHS